MAKNTKSENIETYAFAPHLGFLWLFFTMFFVQVLYFWEIYLTNAPRDLGGMMALLVMTIVITPPFVLSGLGTFPKAIISKDSVALEYAYSRHLFSREEIAIDPKGRMIRLGAPRWVSIRFGFIPFASEKVFTFLRNSGIEEYKSRPVFVLSFLIPSLLTAFFESFGRLYLAILSGVISSMSLSMIFYVMPAKIWIDNLGRGKSAILFGLSIGVFIFLVTAAPLFLMRYH